MPNYGTDISCVCVQANLLSSLELMTSLAADLPLPASPLRRSATLQPARRTGLARVEVTRKPPLPKLSAGSSSPFLYSPLTGDDSATAAALPTIGQGFSSMKPVRSVDIKQLSHLCHYSFMLISFFFQANKFTW